LGAAVSRIQHHGFWVGPSRGQQQGFKGFDAIQRMDANRSPLFGGFKAQKMGDSANFHRSGTGLDLWQR
jgi:hypothetical protein